MRNYKKKIIISIFAVMMMCLTSVHPVIAAETWTIAGGNYDADYTFTDDNLTPYKIIGDTGTLVVYGYFFKDDSGDSNIKLTAQIRDYPSGKILAQEVVENNDYPFSNNFMISTNVYSGQRIQLYFDASSINNPPGFYRKAYVNYSAYITE